MENKNQIKPITKEQIELAVKLEGIFMPEAKRQRDKYYDAQKREGTANDEVRFAHYTSAEAALKIIKSKNIWMRNTNCMADYREVQHGLDTLNRFFGDDTKQKKFIDTIDACVPGVAQEAIDAFNRLWKNIRFGTYVTSISEHEKKEDLHGRLSMWRAFGASPARVALVFKVPRFSSATLALNIMFSPVAYLTEAETLKVIHEVMDNVTNNCSFLKSVDRQMLVGIIFGMFLAAVTCLKHEGFREEREWRAVYSPTFRASALIKAETEIIGGVPQIIYKLPLDASDAPILADLDFSRIFDRLIIGPSPYSWPMFEAFAEALTNVGVTDANLRIVPSLIPIRT